MQKAYQNRIEKLESEYKWIAFKPIEQSRLDYVLERQGKAPVAETHTDFIAKDNYWDIRPFYSSYSDLEDVLEKEYGFHTKVSARITLEGYRFEQGVLYLYATFSYSIPSQSFLVELTDHLPPKVITNYKEGDFIIPGTPKKTWLGMCGSDTCYSYYASPNHIWQVATKNENDAIYLFPNNKPNEGQLIIENFNPNIKELESEGGNMARNVVWLDDNTLFFDNATAYVCIWRVDIEKKLVEKIIPFHDVQVPFPIKLDNEEYLPFVITHLNDSSAIYLARPPQKKIKTSSN